MFSKAKDQQSESASATQAAAPVNRRANRSAAPSIISGDMALEGKIEASGDIQIDGKVKGDISTGSLTIGEKAFVEGQIVADEITVKGHVSGSIRARKVQLSSTSRVEGDILHQALAVETGAFFEGNCRHSDDPMSEKIDSGRGTIRTTEDRDKSTGSGGNTTSLGGNRPSETSKPAAGGMSGTVVKPPLGATGTGNNR